MSNKIKNIMCLSLKTFITIILFYIVYQIWLLHTNNYSIYIEISKTIQLHVSQSIPVYTDFTYQIPMYILTLLTFFIYCFIFAIISAIQKQAKYEISEHNKEKQKNIKRKQLDKLLKKQKLDKKLDNAPDIIEQS